MHFSTTTASVLFTLMVASLARTEELNSSGVPAACSAICAPIVKLTSLCNVEPETEASSDVFDESDEKRLLGKRSRLTSTGALSSGFEPADSRKEKRFRLTSTSDLADAFEAKNSRKEKRGRLMSSGNLASFEAEESRKEKRGRLISTGNLADSFEAKNSKEKRGRLISTGNLADSFKSKNSKEKRGRLISTGNLADSFEAKNSKEKRERLISTGSLADSFEAENSKKEKRGRLTSSGAVIGAFESKNEKRARMVKKQKSADCVCNNDSFNVAMVGGLCAGCLADNGGVNEAMATIMSQCGFTTSSYAATATAVVADVTVVATKPTET